MSSDAAEMAALSGSPTKATKSAKRSHQRSASQRCRPNCGCLMITVAFTLLGTAALSASIFTDYWERIDYNATSIDLIAGRHNGTHRLTWLFNKTVARIVLVPGGASSATFPTTASLMYSSGMERSPATRPLPGHVAPTQLSGVNSRTSAPSNSKPAVRGPSSITASSSERPVVYVGGGAGTAYAGSGAIDRSPEALAKMKSANWTGLTSTIPVTARHSEAIGLVLNKSATPDPAAARRRRRRRHVQKRSRRPTSPFYLVPLHGGIWHLCVDLQTHQLRMLQEMGLNRDACTEYLANNVPTTNDGDTFISRLSPQYLHHHVQSKMHNLSISCAMVCVILLASAALLGTFGIVKRQISAILITGVMYILAALFAVFSLVIMHCKRNARRESGIIDDVLVSSSEYNEARIFSNSWSMVLGWAGSAVIFVASLFWLFLAKVMRYSHLTFF